MGQSPDIHRELGDGVLRITLNRPDAGNAITNDQRETIIAWLAEADVDPAVRCIVLGATGRFFCTGADLRQDGDGPRPEPATGDIRRTMLLGTIRLMSSLLDSEKPIIARVQGTAAGIGAHLAFCCDLVVVSEEAKFIEIFARRGLACDGLGTWLLPRMVGTLRAKELVLLADDIPAARALELGLATRVVPAAELDMCVDELAGRLAAGPTKAYGVDKWLINRSFDTDRSAMAQEEAWVVEVLSHTQDAAEGVASFVERRPAEFVGR
jgi:2-(1,2-epoxy-1,2-dihydrophenyl)acetyl-CoA isomerase